MASCAALSNATTRRPASTGSAMIPISLGPATGSSDRQRGCSRLRATHPHHRSRQVLFTNPDRSSHAADALQGNAQARQPQGQLQQAPCSRSRLWITQERAGRPRCRHCAAQRRHSREPSGPNARAHAPGHTLCTMATLPLGPLDPWERCGHTENTLELMCPKGF